MISTHYTLAVIASSTNILQLHGDWTHLVTRVPSSLQLQLTVTANSKYHPVVSVEELANPLMGFGRYGT